MTDILTTYYMFAIKLVVSMLSAIVFLRFFNMKRRLKQTTPLDLVINFVLSAIISGFILGNNLSIIEFIGVMVIYSAFIYLVNLIIYNTNTGRNFFIGRPQVLINKGEVNIDKMKKLKVGATDLAVALRQHEIKSIADVQNAQLEAAGELTVVKKGEENYSLILVDNGLIITDALKRINKTQAWLKKELLKYGVQDVANVFVAQWDKNHLAVITIK